MVYFLQYHRRDSVAEFTLNDSTDLLRGHEEGKLPQREAAPGVISFGHCCKCFSDDLVIAIEHLHLHYLY